MLAEKVSKVFNYSVSPYISILQLCSSVTLEFFDDILIPPTMLPHPSRFDEAEQAWIWEYDVGDGSKHDLFMDPGEQIRFKVISENFTEINPTGPEITDPNQPSTAEKTPENRAAFSLTVTHSLTDTQIAAVT